MKVLKPNLSMRVQIDALQQTQEDGNDKHGERKRRREEEKERKEEEGSWSEKKR